MPATVTTKEPIASNVTDEEVQREIALRIQAGAIQAKVVTENGQRVLVTEWNVLGSNA